MIKKSDITVIIDRSGSMASTAAATVEGFNRFVEEQKAVPGEGVWTLVQFDDRHAAQGAGEQFPQVIFEARDQKESPHLTKENYRPRGGTALIDACCITIDRIGQRLAAMPESERPDGVLVVIITDGQENASSEFKKADLSRRIAHQQSKYGWKFLFLGANQDASAEGASYGVSKGSSFNYVATSVGTADMYAGVSRVTRSWKLDGNDSAKQMLTPCDPDPVNVNVSVSVTNQTADAGA